MAKSPGRRPLCPKPKSKPAPAARKRSPRVAQRRALHVLSDAAGNLPRHMLIAFLTQFPPGTFEVLYKPFLRTVAEVEAALCTCDPATSIVMHALVSAAAKEAAERYCEANRIPCRDLTGRFV